MPPHPVSAGSHWRTRPSTYSAALAGCLSRTAAAVLLVLWGIGQAAFGDAVRGILALTEEPIAPRGGVLMLPLGAQHHGENWPATIPLIFADGATIEGTVVWIYARERDPARPRRWTGDPSGLAVRPIAPGDDSTAGEGAPYLLARLPADGEGPIEVGNPGSGRLRPVWRDLYEAPIRVDEPESKPLHMQLEDSPDRPDPRSPFEYWRWALLAERLGSRPPSAHAYGPVGSLVAEHYAGLWRIGLGRLARPSPGVAATCRDLLTRICTDRGSPGGRFAGWVAEPEELRRLLSILLDPSRTEARLVNEALAWADIRRPLLVWQEGADGEQVQLAIVNRGFEAHVAKLAWEGTADIPIAVELQPGLLTRVRLDRPPLPGPTGLAQEEEPQRQVLLIEAPGQPVRVVFGRRRVTARPPGVFFPPLLPPLTLAEIESGRQHLIEPARATSMHVRRLWDRWEVFFECRREHEDPGTAVGDDPLRSFAGPLDVRGVEAVTLLIGPEDDPTVALTVPETGWHRLFIGGNDGTLQVHRRSFSDRWYCRIVLPEAWLPVLMESTALRFGGIRAHGDGVGVETSPATSAPWCQAPGRAAILLGAWDGVPQP